MSAVALHWAPRLHDATTVRLDVPRREAERWLVDNIGRDDRVIIGDEFWIYLVQHGFDHRPVRGGFFSRTLVVYWPLDYDPAVKRVFPGGWRDFDYIISTEAMRATTEQTPTTRAALEIARRHFSDLAAPIGVGTDADLYELQLQPPPADADFIAWSMNPQVHAADAGLQIHLQSRTDRRHCRLCEDTAGRQPGADGAAGRAARGPVIRD